MNDIESNLNNPETVRKSLFRKQVLSFPWLLSADDFDKATDDSFAELLLQFDNNKEVQSAGKKENDSEAKWLAIFKNNYHKRIAGKLANAEFEAVIASSLFSLTNMCKDYLIWYYEDAFSIAQISAVTGQSLPIIKKELWACRLRWQETSLNSLASYSAAVPDEKRFWLLADYFNNELPVSEAIETVTWFNYGDAATLKSDALELLLRHYTNDNSIKKKQDTDKRNMYLSADEFLQLAKEKIQQQRNQNMP